MIENKIKFISIACQKTTKILNKIINNLEKWISEIEVSKKIESEFKKVGWDEIAFDTIVAFGENSAEPHHETGKRKLKNWDNVLIDCGMKYKGYCADISRTILFWDYTKEQKRIFNLVKQAHKMWLELMKAWEKCSDIHNKIVDFFKENKVEKHFIHSLWHWVWLKVHESPSIWPKSKETLQVWDVVTCEPWLYFKWKFWVRIEDTVIITENWCEVLTTL